MKFKFKNTRRIIAFSLIELMISLITISFITSAFAPVITKKLRHNTVTVSNADATSPNCGHIDEDCMRCTREACLICDKDCEDDEYKDVEGCKCRTCIKDFGKTCVKCNKRKCKQCIAGYYLENDKERNKSTCIICPKESISDETGICKNCKDGEQANKDHTACEPCEAGHYCPSGDKKDCEKGYKCPAGSSQHTECAEGTYQNETKKSSCKNCDNGKWTSKKAQTSCNDPCPAGSYCVNGVKKACNGAMEYSKSGASKCSTCADGTQPNSNHTDCESCAAGYYCSGGKRNPCTISTYSTGGKSACSPCDAGKTSPQGATSKSDCTPCPEGQTSTSGGACTACTDKGIYCTGGQKKKCEPGYYCPGGKREECAAGTYSGEGASKCTNCGAGTYSSKGQSVCSNCAAGKTSSGGASKCTDCSDGYISSSGGACTPCAAGKWSTNHTSCSKCPAGYACKGDGVKDKCASGYGSSEGSSVCKKCSDFSAKCNSCTSTACTGCSSGYLYVRNNICYANICSYYDLAYHPKTGKCYSAVYEKTHFHEIPWSSCTSKCANNKLDGVASHMLSKKDAEAFQNNNEMCMPYPAEVWTSTSSGSNQYHIWHGTSSCSNTQFIQRSGSSYYTCLCMWNTDGSKIW